ncbi:MAG: aldehyde dehydrogenase family protein [Polyangiaceae bacterium]|nr:aldehyde dehydrogenase family protein [Polyangiaceae bacterium]
MWLAGEPATPNLDLEVRDKHDGSLAARVPLASPADLDAAIEAAWSARRAMRELPAYARRDALSHVVRQVEARREELAIGLAIEAGKPLVHADGEVGRLIDTFRIAAEEATRIGGETLPLDVTPRAAGYRGRVERFPVGACGFVTPFNFPLNLVAHKVAPAIAAGCPFVLKPASATPVGALVLGEILAEAGLPRGAFSILPARRLDAEVLARDPRLALLSFTGSSEVGWRLRDVAGTKRVSLELGGNAAVIVEPSWDLDDAAARITFGAFYQSGQSCISVQRVFAHESVFDALVARLVARAEALVVGPPLDPHTFLGPLVSAKEADRVERWIASAVARGARLLCGGERRGAALTAAWLTGVPDDEPLSREEAFGPVAILEPYSDFSAALARVDATRFGLQAGVFTRDLYRAEQAFRELEVGGVIIGDVPSFRVDNMPYGGVRDSGNAREGVRYAIEEMTERRLMVVRTP